MSNKSELIGRRIEDINEALVNFTGVDPQLPENVRQQLEDLWGEESINITILDEQRTVNFHHDVAWGVFFVIEDIGAYDCKTGRKTKRHEYSKNRDPSIEITNDELARVQREKVDELEYSLAIEQRESEKLRNKIKEMQNALQKVIKISEEID